METIIRRNFSLAAMLSEIFNPTQTRRRTETNSYVSAINGLSKFDLPYVYHHLYVGRRLNLKVLPDAVEVYYRSHKLGELPKPASSGLLDYLEKDYTVSVTISGLLRERYLPVKDIEITLEFFSGK